VHFSFFTPQKWNANLSYLVCALKSNLDENKYFFGKSFSYYGIFMTSGKGHLCLKYLTLSKTFNVMLNISNTNDLFHNHHLMLCAIILQLIDWTYMFLKPEGYFIYFMLILLRPFILKKKWRINEMVSINLN